MYSYQFLTVGFIVGGLWKGSVVQLAICTAIFYFISVAINRRNHAEVYGLYTNRVNLKNLEKTVALCLEHESCVFLFTGIFIGGFLFSNSGSVPLLGFLLFLIGLMVAARRGQLHLFSGSDLDLFLGLGLVAGALCLRSYQNVVLGGFIVNWLYQAFSKAHRYQCLYCAYAVGYYCTCSYS